jgi:hypothetical protein
MDKTLHQFISACLACHLIDEPRHPQFQCCATDTATDTDILIAYLEWDTGIAGFTKSFDYK